MRARPYVVTSHKQERRLFKRLESKYREDKQATDRAYADAADYERKRARRESLVSTTTTSGNESATTSPRPRPRSTSPRRSGHGGHGGHGHGAAAAGAVVSATVTTAATSATVTAPSATATSIATESDVAVAGVADAVRTDDLANMDDVSSRKTLFHLITTLNLTFPDYDFSSIKPQHFSMHTLPEVQQRVSAIFFQTGGDLYARCMSEKLWCALDEVGHHGRECAAVHVHVCTACMRVRGITYHY